MVKKLEFRSSKSGILYFPFVGLVIWISLIFNLGTSILLAIPVLFGWSWFMVRVVTITDNECKFARGFTRNKITITPRTVIRITAKSIDTKGTILKLVSNKQELIIPCGPFSRKQLTAIVQALTARGCKADKGVLKEYPVETKSSSRANPRRNQMNEMK